MIAQLRPAVVLLTLMIALTGLIYPLAITGITQLVMPRSANGSLVERGGTIVGSALLGQAFTSERYFHSRPSATSAPDPKDPAKTLDAPYNAAGSGGSNLGPTSQKLVERVKAEVERMRPSPSSTNSSVPADAATASGSGLDPHISPQFASLQVERVARVRGISPARVEALLVSHLEGPWLGFLGERRVNVLALNMALDRLAAR